MTNPDCLFCKLVSRQIPGRIVYEDAHTLAFLDVVPRTTGHTMVIPKEHVATLLELPDPEVAPLFAAVKKVAEMMSKNLKPDGITIGMNQGRASGQEVDHLHVHLLPRWHGDGGSAIQSVVHKAPTENLDDIRKQIIGE